MDIVGFVFRLSLLNTYCATPVFAFSVMLCKMTVALSRKLDLTVMATGSVWPCLSLIITSARSLETSLS